jgi:hypothetical protein
MLEADSIVSSFKDKLSSKEPIGSRASEGGIGKRIPSGNLPRSVISKVTKIILYSILFLIIQAIASALMARI